MLIYHASKQIVESPEIRKTKFTKDFSWGFYCTNDFKQAVRWANRGEGTPYVNHYEFTDSGSLKIPTHQISFHTLSALACLKFLKYEVAHDECK